LKLPVGHKAGGLRFFGPTLLPLDYIIKLKRRVHDAMQTQAWFGKQGAAWAQPLPLVHYGEQEKILCSSDLPRHLVVYYANSLQRLAFKYLEHPLFFDYARGVMCRRRPICRVTRSCWRACHAARG
jgi:hypothetical protein